MKVIIAFALSASMLVSQACYADTTKSLVRIACVPEAGLFDMDSRGLHDSVARDPKDQKKRDAALSRAGFHEPRGLNFSCVLGDTTYVVSTEQGPGSNVLCGASPELYLTVTRNGAKFISDVVFGYSCNQFPSIERLTIGDGPNSWRGRETQVCYASGDNGVVKDCHWTFGTAAEFDKRFPIDQNGLRKKFETAAAP